MSQVRAFDTSIGTNFTNDACPNFFDSFTGNSSFNDCHPLSFYLQTSQSYIREIRKGQSATEAIVDKSCNVDFTKCKKVMSDLDKQLMKHCEDDYRQENPLVIQAHEDFLAYGVIHDATCLKYHGNSTKESTKYCYTESLFGPDSSSTLDGYLYQLPLGSSLPGTEGNNAIRFNNNTKMNTSCSDCTKRVMDVFQSYTSDEEIPITHDYKSAAEEINRACSQFVNSTLLPASSQSASQKSTSGTGLGERQRCTYAALPPSLVMIVAISMILAVLG